MRNKCNNRGFSLVELLIGLAIGVLLFTATASAIQAGSQSTKVNQEFFTTTQAGRVALLHLTQRIRTSAPATSSTDPSLEPQDQLVLLDPNGVDYSTYKWDGAQLLLTRGTTSAVLADHVSGFKVVRQGRLDPATGTYTLSNFQISMTVSLNNTSVTMCESAVPRRAMELH